MQRAKEEAEPATEMQPSTRSAGKLVAGYLVIAGAWILLSDSAVRRLADDTSTLSSIQSLKGLGFILVTGCYLFVLVLRMLHHLQVLNQSNQVARQHLNLALESSKQTTWEWELDSDQFQLSAGSAELFGIERLRDIHHRQDWEALLKPDQWRLLCDSLQRYAQSPRGIFQTEFRIEDDRGDSRWLWLRGRAAEDAGGAVRRVVGTLLDTTEREQVEHQLRQAAAVFSSTSEGVMITDADHRILAVNSAFTEITGYPDIEVVGKSASLLRSGHHDDAFYREMKRSIDEDHSWQGEVWNRHKSGRIYPEWLTISAVRDNSGRIVNYVGLFTDISASKSSEEQLHYLSHYDALTGLPNRLQLEQELERLIVRAPQGERIALLSLDLDRFRQINQSMGHPYGDRLLTAFTQRLRQHLGPQALISRFAADQFVLVLRGDETRWAQRIAERILEAMRAPLMIDGDELFLSVSIGIAFHTSTTSSAHDLIQDADNAREQIKSEGGGGYRFFTEEIGRATRERMVLEADLHRALAKGELQLYYQPQLDVRDNTVVGVEALVRWQHPQQGLIAPGRFLPVADACGLTPQIDTWALEEACRQSTRWDDAGLPPLRMAVNLSGARMAQPELANDIRAVLRHTGITPQRLELEVTEDFISSDPTAVTERLREIRELGVNLAVDDFGTGYSSLSYLQNFPLTHLKIDKSFIDAIDDHANSGAIARAIIGLGDVLGLQIIAEGVETDTQYRWLTAHGCHEAQGFLFARPMPAADIPQWLRNHVHTFDSVHRSASD